MTGLLVFGGFVAVILYIAGIFYLGGKIQDWTYRSGFPPVLTSWVFCMAMLIGLPLSIVAGLSQ